MKVKVELFTFDGEEHRKMVHSVWQQAHSLAAVEAAAMGLVEAPELSVDGYRIVRTTGRKYAGPNSQSEKAVRSGTIPRTNC